MSEPGPNYAALADVLGALEVLAKALELTANYHPEDYNRIMANALRAGILGFKRAIEANIDKYAGSDASPYVARICMYVMDIVEGVNEQTSKAKDMASSVCSSVGTPPAVEVQPPTVEGKVM